MFSGEDIFERKRVKFYRFFYFLRFDIYSTLCLFHLTRKYNRSKYIILYQHTNPHQALDSPSQGSWGVLDTGEDKLRCIDHIKDALQLHVFRLQSLLDVLPYTRLMFTPKQKSMVIMKCYVEIIVLRWVQTTNTDKKSIRGVTGIDYSWSDMW